MPRSGSPYDHHYEQERKRLLASRPRCWWPDCNAVATEADHDPPVAFHRHLNGGRCTTCVLRPACSHHQRVQGGEIRAGRLTMLAADEPELMGEPDGGYAADDPVWVKPWLEDLLEVPDNATWPRFMTAPHPRAVGSLGLEFEWWCRTHRRTELLWWQRLVARRLLEVDANGRLVWLTLILTLARQLGKSWLLWLILSWRLHQGPRFGVRQALLHMSIDKAQAAGVMAAEAEFVEDSGLYDVQLGTSKQGTMSVRWLADGSSWDVITKGTSRSGGGYGRSSTSIAVVDEAWSIAASTVDNGLEPTTLQGVQALLGLISTAHPKTTGLMPARRLAALLDLAAVEESTLLVEWSAPRNAALEDRTAWRAASPAWDAVREERLRGLVRRALLGISSEEDGGLTPAEAVRTQHFNIWPLMAADAAGSEPLMDAASWDAAEVDVTPDGALVLAVEDWMGSGAGVAYAGLDEDRIVLGGYTFESRSKAYEWIAPLAKREGSLVLVGTTIRDDPELVDIGATVETRTTADTRSALSLLRELLRAGRLVQDGQDEATDLRDQMTSTRVRSAPGGGLMITATTGRVDLVKAAAWAVAEVERGTLVVATVHGGPVV